jgi:hypothetical protein
LGERNSIAYFRSSAKAVIHDHVNNTTDVVRYLR